MKIEQLRKSLSEISVLLNGVEPKGAEKMIAVARLMEIASVSQDDEMQVPADVFECLGPDLRKLALAGFAYVVMRTLEE